MLALAQPLRDLRAQHRAIGSVLPMPSPPPAPPRPDSLWSCWRGGHRHAAAYATARSAIAALLEFRGIARVWLPSYCCPALAEAASVCDTLWYGVDATLSPELEALAAGLRRGDAVVAIAYFGRSPDQRLRALAASRPDVLWIEDRAQALAPDCGDWADVTVYSPRKLVGVGDGGLLVGHAALPQPAGPPVDRPAQAQRARAADPDGARPEHWFPAFRTQEAAFRIDDAPMDAHTRAILPRIAAAPIAARRVANARVLAEHLAELALWPQARAAFAPLAFPVLLADAPAVAARLAQDGIYCARHWAALPSPPDRFAQAHRLSERLLSLPCDQRYGSADMLRVVQAVRASGAAPA